MKRIDFAVEPREILLRDFVEYRALNVARQILLNHNHHMQEHERTRAFRAAPKQTHW